MTVQVKESWASKIPWISVVSILCGTYLILYEKLWYGILIILTVIIANVVIKIYRHRPKRNYNNNGGY